MCSRNSEEQCAGAKWKRERIVRTEFERNERPDHVTCHTAVSPRHPARFGVEDNVT